MAPGEGPAGAGMTGSGAGCALTIAIPTYERAASVEAAIQDALGGVDDGQVEVLVIDDGSRDATFETIRPYARAGVRVLRNEQNQGYAATLCRLVRETETEWVLVSADDD